MKSPFNPSRTKKVRQHLRNNMPPAERALWQRLKGKQLNGYKFRRQFGVGDYIVDFFCPQMSLAIEVDGPSHFREQPDDPARQASIESLGIKVIRFNNEEVLGNLEAVLNKILENLDEP